MREATRHKTRKNARGHHRTSPDITGQSDIVGRKMIVACRRACCRIASRMARRVPSGPSPDRVPSGSSRAVGPVAGHGVTDGRRVPSGASPDHVPSGPSRDRVSSQRYPIRRPRCPCHAHGRASRRPVTCHAPAQHTPVADAANRYVANIFSLVRRGASSLPVRRRG